VSLGGSLAEESFPCQVGRGGGGSCMPYYVVIKEKTLFSVPWLAGRGGKGVGLTVS
jgi:hypothetical protein